MRPTLWQKIINEAVKTRINRSKRAKNCWQLEKNERAVTCVLLGGAGMQLLHIARPRNVKPGQRIDANQPLLCAFSKPGPLGKWSTMRSPFLGIFLRSYLSFGMEANSESFSRTWKKTSDPLPRLSPTGRALPCLKDSMSFTKCRSILWKIRL